MKDREKENMTGSIELRKIIFSLLLLDWCLADVFSMIMVIVIVVIVGIVVNVTIMERLRKAHSQPHPYQGCVEEA
jgi:di/tricarboxylate transporter